MFNRGLREALHRETFSVSTRLRRRVGKEIVVRRGLWARILMVPGHPRGGETLKQICRRATIEIAIDDHVPSMLQRPVSATTLFQIGGRREWRCCAPRGCANLFERTPLYDTCASRLFVSMKRNRVYSTLTLIVSDLRYLRFLNFYPQEK